MPIIHLVDPPFLTDNHLLHEMQAITQFPTNFRMTMGSTKDIKEHKMKVSYRIGAGHSHFFYNKGKFLAKRWNSLRDEIKARNFKWTHDFNNLWVEYNLMDFYNDYTPTYKEYKTSINFLVSRIATNPHHFRYYSRYIEPEIFIDRLYQHLDAKFGIIT